MTNAGSKALEQRSNVTNVYEVVELFHSTKLAAIQVEYVPRTSGQVTIIPLALSISQEIIGRP